MNFNIRPASAADYAKLPGIETAADVVLDMVGLPAASSAEYRESLAVLIAEEVVAEALVVKATGKLLGLARLDEVNGQAHLEQISVLPEAAGHGIGRALIVAVKSWAWRVGYRQLTLCTFRDVPFNAPFYTRCGFSVLEHPTGELLALRRHEKELGLDALGARVAMVAELPGRSG